MKLKQLITGGALAATVLTLGSAQAEERNPYEGIVFCKVQITEVQEGDPMSVSVTLPFTTKGHDGREYTHWNLGKVPAGGVADSWHSEGGPGKFVAYNNGAGAYIYLTSSGYDYLGNTWMNNNRYEGYDYSGPHIHWSNPAPYIDEAFNDIFGALEYGWMRPMHSLKKWQLRGGGYENCYCLAFTRDMDGKLPTWHMLNRWYWQQEDDGRYYSAWEDKEDGESGYIGAYMGYLPAGEYMPFDVKFWAPHNTNDGNPVGFTFRVEAAAFPLWEHDIEVQ